MLSRCNWYNVRYRNKADVMQTKGRWDNSFEKPSVQVSVAALNVSSDSIKRGREDGTEKGMKASRTKYLFVLREGWCLLRNQRRARQPHLDASTGLPPTRCELKRVYLQMCRKCTSSADG